MGPEKDNTPIPRSTVLEPILETEPANISEAVKTVQTELELERHTSPGLLMQQQEERQPKQTLQQEELFAQWLKEDDELRPEPVQQFVALTQHGTYRQWLEWLGKQVPVWWTGWMKNNRWSGDEWNGC